MAGIKGIMKRPIIPTGGNHKDSDVDSKSSQSPTKRSVHTDHKFPSLLKEDHPGEQNLLGNSLSAKLRKNFPGESSVRKPLQQKNSRGNVFHLTQTKDGMDHDVYEKIRRQQQVKKHAEWSRRKQEKLQSRLMSWAVDAERFLPKSSQGERKETENQVPAVVGGKIKFDDFPRGRGSSVISYSSSFDEDSVRMMKKDGVFRPVNKYGSSRLLRGADDLPFSNTIIDYETVTLPLKDKTREQNDAEHFRGKKCLSVSWSAQSFHNDPSDEKKSERDSKSGSVKSFMSEPIAWKRPTFSSGRSKVESVGVMWKLPPQKRIPSTTPPPKQVKASRDLTPVTSGLDREGTSTAKTRWRVKPSGSPESDYGMETVYNIRGSLKALRQMSFRGKMSPRKMTFSGRSSESVCCHSG
ncbi:uncharacterized protein LOC124132374 [Haliotis rufescens]|uniref:uncharacterized protein LOC124132374 n=1 Tax=Haliotis rufescens TaxID=6454 RepID=UPI00201F765A|nr:uncharacterized protein LOC124132374 [Haliotis rufescens]XP_048259219.1 uncharacterized protein LOC124132374 [Haliotis rufescens]